MDRVNIGVRVMFRTNPILGNDLSLHWSSTLHDLRLGLMKRMILISRLLLKPVLVRLTPQSRVLQLASRLPEPRRLLSPRAHISLLLHPRTLLYQLFRITTSHPWNPTRL